MCRKKIKLGNNNLIKNSFNTSIFFSLWKKNIKELVSLIEDKTENILLGIKSTIGDDIKIDRANLIEKIKKSPCELIFVVGKPGVGKTALIHDFYEKKENDYIFLFKGNEFNIKNINELFSVYGNFNFGDFIKHLQKQQKNIYVVIDSAEQIIDIKDIEPFNHFIQEINKIGGKIIFTCRNYYIDNLKFILNNLLSKSIDGIDIPLLENEKVNEYINTKKLAIPQDEKLIKLLQTPFYLDLFFSISVKTDMKVSDFREELRNNKIGSTYEDTNDFMQIAYERAESMSYFINAKGCSKDGLKSLKGKGIIFEDKKRGYAISYDIYEERGLVKYIDKTYQETQTIEDFFLKLPTNLPIRRAFRNRLSEKLEISDDDIKEILDYILDNPNIPDIWKDETITSVLYSEYGISFLNHWKTIILDNNQTILNKIIVLVKVAGKVPDINMLKQIFLENELPGNFTVFLKAEGKIRDSIIKFIFDNKEIINLNNHVIDLLNEYTLGNKVGETAKYCGLLACYYLNLNESEQKKHGYIVGIDRILLPLSKIILCVASEIKEEISGFFDIFLKEYDLIERKNKVPFYTLVKLSINNFILSHEVVRSLPEKIIKLIDKCWSADNKKAEIHMSEELDNAFSIRHEYDLSYFPSSAYQTPIYWLLKHDLTSTLKFIVKFVNKTVESYMQSEFDGDKKEIYLVVDGNKINYFSSQRLYGLYRGFVPAPHVLESIHMALEKHLLEIGKTLSKKELTTICKHLLKEIKGVSIIPILISLVCAYPDKLDEILLILARNKDIFFFDIQRYVRDLDIKSMYSIGLGWGKTENDFCQNERIQTCSEKHRQFKFEDIVRNIQIFKGNDDEEFENRLTKLNKIFDAHFEELQINKDDTREIILNRTDARKLDITLEKYNESQVKISFKPKNQDIINMSEESLLDHNQITEYLPLLNRTNLKLRNEKISGHERYEDNYMMSLEDLKKFLSSKIQKEDMEMLYKMLPINVVFLIVRDHFNEISDEDKQFCTNIIIKYAEGLLKKGTSFHERYIYQIGDEIIFYGLILLLKYNSGNIEIKRLIVESVINLNNELYQKFIVYFSLALRDIDRELAYSIFRGNIFLKNKEHLERESLRTSDTIKKPIWECTMEDLVLDYGEHINNIINGEYINYVYQTFENIPNSILIDAFLMLKSGDEELAVVVNKLCEHISKDLFKDRHSDGLHYVHKNSFLNQLSNYILKLQKKESISLILMPIISKLDSKNETGKDFINTITLIQDRLGEVSYENFRFIWNEILYPKIIEINNIGGGYYLQELISNYLFAGNDWKKTTKSRHTIKDENKTFFEMIIKDMGSSINIIYAISKVLDSVGHKTFFEYGVFWISDLLGKFKEENFIINDKNSILIENTIFYIENYMRKYLLINTSKIKCNLKLKTRIILILDFLIKNGSATAYILRDNI